MHTLADIADIRHLNIRLDVRPESIQTVLSESYKTIVPTHKEEGCLEYRLLHDGTSVMICGKWKNEMALQMHLLLQYHLRLIEEILPPLCHEITINTYAEIDPPITALSLG